jgi:hypothetical protein
MISPEIAQQDHRAINVSLAGGTWQSVPVNSGYSKAQVSVHDGPAVGSLEARGQRA